MESSLSTTPPGSIRSFLSFLLSKKNIFLSLDLIFNQVKLVPYLIVMSFILNGDSLTLK